MFHAPIATGDGDTPSPIRLRVLSLGAEGAIHDAGSFGRARHRRGAAGLCDLRRYRLGNRHRSTRSALADVTERLPFPVHIVSAWNIRDDLLDARAANAGPRSQHSLARSVAALPITVFMTGSGAGGPFWIGR